MLETKGEVKNGLVFFLAEVSGNRLKIAGGAPGLKIPCRVTGIRLDARAGVNRIPEEVDKEKTVLRSHPPSQRVRFE